MLWDLNRGSGWQYFPSAFLPPSLLPPPLVLGMIHLPIFSSAGIHCPLRVLIEFEISARMQALNYCEEWSCQALPVTHVCWSLPFLPVGKSVWDVKFIIGRWAGKIRFKTRGIRWGDWVWQATTVWCIDFCIWDFTAADFGWLNPWTRTQTLRKSYYCGWYTQTIFKSF